MQRIRNAKASPLGKALVIWALILTIVLLYTHRTWMGTENMLSSAHSSVAGPILNDTLITQQLYLPADTTGIQIRVGTYERVNTASLLFEINQEDNVQTVMIPLETIIDNTYITIPFDYGMLTEGDATLAITGRNTGLNNFATIYLSNETIFGQYNNGKTEDKNVNLALSLSYKIIPEAPFRVACVVCLALFLAVLMLALLKEEGVWVPRQRVIKVNYFLIASILFGFVMTFRLSVLDVYANAGYAEVMTNFFQNAYTKGFLENFTKLDAGYYPLLPRIIALLAVKCFGLVNYYPLVMNLITLSLSIFFISVLNFRSMQKVAQSNLLRFVISLSLLLFYINMKADFWALHNIAYSGIILICCFFLTYDKARPFPQILIFGVIAFVLMMSKGIMIAFAPITIIYILYAMRKNRKSLVFCMMVLLGILAQAAVMLISIRDGAWSVMNRTNTLASQDSNFIVFLFNVAIEAIMQFNVRWVLTVTDGATFTFNHIYLICLAVIIAMNVYVLRQKGKTYDSAMMIGMMLSSVCGYAIVIITNNHPITFGKLWGNAVSLNQYAMGLNRQTVLSYFFIVIGIMIIVQALIRNREILKYCVVLMILLNIVNAGIVEIQKKEFYEYAQIPSWNHYTYYLSRDAYGLPIYNTHSTPSEMEWVLSTPQTRSLYMVNDSETYINEYALSEEESRVFRNESLSNLLFLSNPTKTYGVPIKLALYDHMGGLIALLSPVEDRYTWCSVYDMIDVPQDRPVANIRLMQNEKYIHFIPNFSLYYSIGEA